MTDKVIKVSKELESILKHAGSIHRNIMVKEDSDILRVKSPDSTLMMTAKLPEKMPGKFVIYDIMEFLAVLSLFNEPTMDMEDPHFVKVMSGNGETSISYLHADERMISGFVEKDLVPDEVLVEFTLGADKITNAARAAATLKLPNFAFVGDGSSIALSALDSKLESGSQGNTFKTKLGDTDKTFKIIFASDNLKMMPGDYTVKIGKRKGALISVFKSQSNPVVYVMAVAAESEFSE